VNRIKLFFLALVLSLVCASANTYACDEYNENGGFIFLKAALITHSTDHAILNVQVSANDFLRVKSGLSNCNLTVYVRFPNMKIKLYPYSSGLLVGYEPRHARFVKITSR
jgi:hypothetical protein